MAWQPIPVFLPGESHGQGSLASYSLWGRKQSDMTEQLTHTREWGNNTLRASFHFPLHLSTQIPSQSLESGAQLINVCTKNQEGRNLPLHYQFLFPMVNQLHNKSSVLPLPSRSTWGGIRVTPRKVQNKWGFISVKKQRGQLIPDPWHDVALR